MTLCHILPERRGWYIYIYIYIHILHINANYVLEEGESSCDMVTVRKRFYICDQHWFYGPSFVYIYIYIYIHSESHTHFHYIFTKCFVLSQQLKCSLVTPTTSFEHLWPLPTNNWRIICVLFLFTANLICNALAFCYKPGVRHKKRNCLTFSYITHFTDIAFWVLCSIKYVIINPVVQFNFLCSHL